MPLEHPADNGSLNMYALAPYSHPHWLRVSQCMLTPPHFLAALMHGIRSSQGFKKDLRVKHKKTHARLQAGLAVLAETELSENCLLRVLLKLELDPVLWAPGLSADP